MFNFYFLNLAIVFIAALLAKVLGKKDSLAYSGYKPKILFTFIALSCLVLFAGLRSNVCGDELAYRRLYLDIGANPILAFSYKDFGFGILFLLLNKISTDPQLMIFITALLTNILVVWGLYKYADPFELGMFLYVTADLYYVSWNGIRQILVGAILFCSVGYLIKGNWKKYFIIVALVSTLHLTALMFIPIYFIVRRRAWSLLIWIIIGLACLSRLFFSNFLEVLFKFLERTRYLEYQNTFAVSEEAVVSSVRILILLIPLILALFNMKKLRILWKDSDIFVNLSIFSFIFMLFGAKEVTMSRLCLYFNFYLIILLAKLTKVFDNVVNSILYISIIIGYFIFSTLVISKGWGMYYRSVFG